MGGAWQWRRRLCVWEEDLVEESRALLLTVSLQEFDTNRWVWLSNQIGGYSIRGGIWHVDIAGTTSYSSKYGVNLA